MRAFITEQPSIRFGEFELSPRSGELRKRGAPVRLQPQPLKVLALLVANAGRLVTREEIQRAVWNGETFVDFEHGLNFCIKQIRAALGDNAQSPLFIETLPRRGYRFIAPVEEVAVEPPQPAPAEEVSLTPASPVPASAVPAAPVPASRHERRRLRAGAVIFVTALIVAGYFAWQRYAPRAGPAKAKVMLAVMPFENLSRDPDEDYFSDGMTEEMIAQLGSLQPARLGVIARTSAMTYKRGDKDVRQIGGELNVDYILEGSVRREGDRVRITAQLIQISDQTHLWSESYERNQQDALTVQSEVARSIARALALEFLPPEKTGTVSDTSMTTAHDAYLKGRYLWNKGRADDIEKSISQYERAIEIAPDYGLAYAGLADSYILLGMYRRPSPMEAYPKAKDAAMRALVLDDKLAEARTSLGTILFRFDWDWPGAEAEFKRAIDLNPSYSRAHHDYAWFLVAMQRFDEAVAEIKRACELDPLSPLANSDVGWVYLRARRYDDAIEQIQRTLELEPNFASAEGCLERAYAMKGEHRKALDQARKAMLRAGASPEELAALDNSDAAEGMKSVARWRLKRLNDPSRKWSASPYSIAQYQAELGEKDAALASLERAVSERDSEVVSLLVDPAFDNLRSSARFADLLRRVGLR
ncbi:MAG TPA: winged helix-turn-helix domain-containing protein [Blastocatellia bacterium]|nr:winged helix-turn-helix domain-containing protein [Blastocatellia bacterium]